MSRSDILRSIVSELSGVRNLAVRANESILLYLIDVTILEVQSKITTGAGERHRSNPRRFSRSAIVPADH